MNLTQAMKLRAAMVTASESLDDKTASTAPEMFGKLKQSGALVKAGTRINWNGVVKKANVDLWDTAENSPENAPDLWSDLAFHDGYRIIPTVFTAELAFSEGETGWWEQDGCYYTAKANGTVWTPSEYPSAWTKKE